MDEYQKDIPKLPAPKKQGVWSKVILIIIAGFIGYFIGRGTVATAPTSTNNDSGNDAVSGADAMMEDKKEGDATTPLLMKGKGTITIEEQESGTRVTIKKIDIEGAHWIAIYEEVDGNPGNILGAKRFLAPEENATINLLRSTENEKRYFAILHGDDGDMEFEFKGGDSQLVGENGNLISVEFMIKNQPASQQ